MHHRRPHPCAVRQPAFTVPHGTGRWRIGRVSRHFPLPRPFFHVLPSLPCPDPLPVPSSICPLLPPRSHLPFSFYLPFSSSVLFPSPSPSLSLSFFFLSFFSSSLHHSPPFLPTPPLSLFPLPRLPSSSLLFLHLLSSSPPLSISFPRSFLFLFLSGKVTTLGRLPSRNGPVRMTVE